MERNPKKVRKDRCNKYIIEEKEKSISQIE